MILSVREYHAKLQIANSKSACHNLPSGSAYIYQLAMISYSLGYGLAKLMVCLMRPKLTTAGLDNGN
jgi:hypothetical protein